MNKDDVKEVRDEPTVDDLVPVLAELERRVLALEDVLRRHEHNSKGEPVVRL